ncbi:hypothetical protein DACRYDRAFT_24243, partial [Dacryopinax primogenitus]
MKRRKRMGCGCEVSLLACTTCGTHIGTHTTHLCKLHSLRNSPTYKARYRFLPSRVFLSTSPLLPPLTYRLPPSPSPPEPELEGFATPPPSPRSGGNWFVF